MIQRKLAQRLLQLSENKDEFNNVILIEGARQVGKTTLIRETLTDNKIPHQEFNLEEQRELAERIDQCTNFDAFTELVETEMKFKTGGGKILFIDEAQESRHLGGFIRFMKEKWRNTQVILSGSILSRLFGDDVRYPVGRITMLHLNPFSFSEFLTAGDKEFAHALLTSKEKISKNTHERFIEYLDIYFEVGGLPEVVTTYFAKKDWHKLRSDLLLGYYNDFKRVFGEEKQSYFIASLQATANLLGKPFKNSHVALAMDGAKNKEIMESLGQLEAWKMIFKIEQRGTTTESQFHPKRYLFDIGIAKQLREAAMPALRLGTTMDSRRRTPLGGLVENMTMLSLVDDLPDLTGWKKAPSGSEVDFIAKWKDSALPIECKAALSIKNSHLGGIRDFMNIHDVKTAIVVCLAPFEVRTLPEKTKVIILPLYLVEFWKDILREYCHIN